MSRSRSNLWLLVTEWPEKEGEEASDWTFKDNLLFFETFLSGSSVFIESAKENQGKDTHKDQNDIDVDGRNEIVIPFPMHCTMYTLDSFSSFQPRAVGHIAQPRDCHIIEHIFVPTLSVERNNGKIRFPWASNSKFVIFPQILPFSNYKICPIMPLLFPVSNGDSPVATTFPL